MYGSLMAAMPPNFCTSSVVSCTMASMTSSTVTIPMTRPWSTTGTASRSYFEISRATSSRSMRGVAVIRRPGRGRESTGAWGSRGGSGGDQTAWRGYGEHRCLRISGDEPAQGDRLDQLLAERIQHVDRVDGFPAAFHVTDIVECLLDGVGRGNAGEFRRHDRSGGVLRILQQAADVDPGVGVQQIEQFGAVRLLYLMEDVGDSVGRHAGQQLCGCFPRHQRDEVWFAFQPRLVEDFNGAVGRQAKQKRGCEFRRHCVAR